LHLANAKLLLLAPSAPQPGDQHQDLRDICRAAVWRVLGGIGCFSTRLTDAADQTPAIADPGKICVMGLDAEIVCALSVRD
jgi:hypothetical protein